MPLRESIIKYAHTEYKATADYPWKKYPDYAVLRHQRSRKWFALFMNVPKEKLGLAGEGRIDIVNVKCRPELIGSYRAQTGFLPAYHMNKEHWLSVLLDNTIAEADILSLIDDSYQLTKT